MISPKLAESASRLESARIQVSCTGARPLRPVQPVFLVARSCRTGHIEAWTFATESNERVTGKTYCGIANGAMAVSEAARTFGLADDSAIFRTIGRVEADAIATRILHTDLAYSTKIMALARANHLWQRFLEVFEGQDVEFATNAGKDACSWMPATMATFDLGVLVIGTTNTGCLWVEDED